MSAENNRRWFTYLLRIMYHDAVVFHAAVAKLEPAMLQHEELNASPAQKLIYGCMYQHYQDFDESSVGRETLATYLEEAISTAGDGDPFLSGMINQVKAEVVKLYGYIVKPLTSEESPAKALDFCKLLYERTALRPKLEVVVEQAMLSSDYQSISETINETMMLMGDTRKACDPFDFGQTENSVRISAGEKWLNHLLVGGWRAGLGYGIICPTGGGKTTMATQCTFDIAKEGRPVAVVYTEQTMQEREMVAKCWSLVTGEVSDIYCTPDAEELEKAVNMIGPEDRETMNIVRDNAQIYDFSVKQGSIEELRLIAAGKAGNKKPSALFIDWAGEFAKDLMLTDPRLKGDNETRALSYVADACARIAREFMIPVVVFHQMGESHVGSPTKKYDHGMAHLCKNFCHNLAYGIVICPRDEDNITRIEITKGRYSDRAYQIVRLDGPHSRFRPLDNYVKGPRKYEPINRTRQMPSNKNRNRTVDDGTDMSGFNA